MDTYHHGRRRWAQDDRMMKIEDVVLFSTSVMLILNISPNIIFMAL